MLDGLTLPVTRGRITVLMGPSGVGKTTCVRHLTGLSTPRSGQVLVDGRDLCVMSEEEVRQQQRRMSVMLQGSTLFGAGLSWSLPVFDNVALPLRVRDRLSEEEIAELVHRSLAQTGLARRAGALPSELSAGMLQRVALARALVSSSEIVILDSVETGMDGVRLQALADMIRSAQRGSRGTFLIATHDPGLARSLADVLAVMRRGRVEALGSPDEVLRDEASFAARFVGGDPASGLSMGDELEEPRPAPPEPKQPSDATVTFLSVASLAVMAAIVLILVVTAVFFSGPMVPPGT